MRSALLVVLSILPFIAAAPTRRQIAVMRLRRRLARRQQPGAHLAALGNLALPEPSVP